MTLIESLEQQADDARAAALAQYREILTRNNNPRTGDAKELRRAMDLLGFGQDRLRRDLAAVEQADRLGEEADGWTTDQDQALTAAWKAVSAWRDETQAIVRQRETEQRRLELAAESLSRKREGARGAAQRLAAVRRQHAELFGLPPVPPVPEPRFGMHIAPAETPQGHDAGVAVMREFYRGSLLDGTRQPRGPNLTSTPTPDSNET